MSQASSFDANFAKQTAIETELRAPVLRQTPGAWQRLVDGIEACFVHKTADLEPRAGNTLRKYDPFLTLSFAAIVVFGILATVGSVHAGEKGHRLGAPADIKSWIDGLANQNGGNCCSDADGVRPQAVDWDIGKNRYRVRVGGQWIDVPDDAVIQGPNYLGHAVVWIYEEPIPEDPYVDSPYIRCFLPGPAS